MKIARRILFSFSIFLIIAILAFLLLRWFTYYPDMRYKAVDIQSVQINYDMSKNTFEINSEQGIQAVLDSLPDIKSIDENYYSAKRNHYTYTLIYYFKDGRTKKIYHLVPNIDKTDPLEQVLVQYCMNQ